MLKGTNHNGCRHGYKTETEKKRKKEKKRKTRETIKTLVWAFCKSYKHSLHIQRNLETAENELQKRKKKAFEMRKKGWIGYKSLDWDWDEGQNEMLTFAADRRNQKHRRYNNKLFFYLFWFSFADLSGR